MDVVNSDTNNVSNQDWTLSSSADKHNNKLRNTTMITWKNSTLNNTAVFRRNKSVTVVKSNTNNVVNTSSRKNIPTLSNNTIRNCNTNKVYNSITKNDVKDNSITTSIVGNTFDNSNFY